ncbi:MAG TPA: hypothetical protein PLR24_09780, partial [Saprospiraceae bacterium]|nr:hypothetical protein [Saprospiraceae bacterium]
MSKKEIDFKWNDEFLDACGISDDELQSSNIMDEVRPIRTLYRTYWIITAIMNKGKNLRKEDLTEFDFENDVISKWTKIIIRELPIYEAVYAIMTNDIDRFIRLINDSPIDINYPMDNTIVFKTPYHESVKQFTFLTIAATLGRYNFVKYLIEHGADVSKRIMVLGPWHTRLSVNECMIMNTLFQWYKSGMKKKINKSVLKELIDLIIAASQKDPLIVSNEFIHPDETSMRVNTYWLDLREAAPN